MWIDIELFKKLFHFGKYTVGNNLSSIIAKSIDTWMLGILISPMAVAAYNPAWKISSLVEVPTGALSTYLYPKISFLASDNQLKKIKEKVELIIGFNLALFLPVLIILYSFAERIIILFAGTNYIGSTHILYITLAYTLMVPFERHMGVAFNTLGKAKYNLWLSLVRAGLNVVLNYILIIQLGIVGAAIATLITYIVGVVISFKLIQQFLQLDLAVIISFAYKSFHSPIKTAKKI